jgi:hypothetical protein
MINSKVHESGQHLRDQANNLRSSAVEFVDRGKQEIGRQKTGVAEAVEAGKQAYRRAAGS